MKVGGKQVLKNKLFKSKEEQDFNFLQKHK